MAELCDLCVSTQNIAFKLERSIPQAPQWLMLEWLSGGSADGSGESIQFDSEGVSDELEVRIRCDPSGSLAGSIDLGELGVAQADSTLRGRQRNGGELGEVGLRRGRGVVVAELDILICDEPHVEAVARFPLAGFPALQHPTPRIAPGKLETGDTAVGHAFAQGEGSARAAGAEAHIHDPPFLTQIDQIQLVGPAARWIGEVDPGQQRPCVETQGAKDPQHETVEFETVASAPVGDQFLEHRVRIQVDSTTRQDIEILERDGEELGLMKRGKPGGVDIGSTGQSHPLEIAVEMAAAENFLHGRRILTGWDPEFRAKAGDDCATVRGRSRINWDEANRQLEVRVPKYLERVVFSPLRLICGRSIDSGVRSTVDDLVVIVVVAFALVPSVLADTATQSDWSGGRVENGAVAQWDTSWAEAEGISWLAVPGQITLSGVNLETAEMHVIDDGMVASSSLNPVDMDGDGDLDLVGSAFDGNRIRWWRNDGGYPPLWTGLDIESGFAGGSSVHTGDIDGDGTVDVVGCAWVENEIAIWFNQGQGLSWTRQSVTTDFGQCHWVDLADLDADGDLDLLGAAAEADTVAVWINDGAVPVGLTMHVIDDSFDGARSLVPADLDGDGDVDLLGTALEADDLSWWSNEGGDPISWIRHIVDDDLAGSHHAGAWDMDLDGDLDIVALGYRHPWLKLYWNDGGDPLMWRDEDIGRAVVTPLVLGAGDLDGDGDMDVAATSDAWNRVIRWQNDGGQPADWPSENVVTHFPGPWPLSIADFDGNGALDVVAGAGGGSEVAWWRLTDFVASGSLTSRVLAIPGDVVSVECDIDANAPPGTGIGLMVRFGAASDDLGEWVSLEPGRRLAVMKPSPVYLQYRLDLGTSDATAAPIVHAVEIRWTGELPVRESPGRRVAP